MNNKHKKTKKEIFEIPVPSNIKWDDIESFAKIVGKGSGTIAQQGSSVALSHQGTTLAFGGPKDKGGIGGYLGLCERGPSLGATSVP